MQLSVTANHEEEVNVNSTGDSDMMMKMMQMLNSYEEKASETDNSIAAMKNQFKEKMEAIQVENHELKAQIKMLETNEEEEMEGEEDP